MATLDLTLDKMRFPGIENFNPEFGTKEAAGRGVHSVNLSENDMMPFLFQRPVSVVENSSTGAIEADRKLAIETSGVTLTLGRPFYPGCKVTVYGSFSSGTATIVYDKDANDTASVVVGAGEKVELEANAVRYFEFNAGGGDVGDIKPSFSAAAPYGWLNCDKSVIMRADYPKLMRWAESNNLIGSGKLFEPHSDDSKIYLPDLREVTLKGVGLTSKSNNHYNSDGLALGDFIEDRVQAHKHSINHGHSMNQTALGLATNTAMSFVSQVITGFLHSTVPLAVNDHTGDSGNNKTGRSGDTTEVKAVGVNWIIKAM
ncbi:MAG: hypothetical protein J6V90_07895 [Treponema sp.]|nr:hypothetical protein [Treponema sp.]